MKRRIPIALLALSFVLAGHVRAHDPGLSSARLELAAGQSRVELTFARRDVELLAPIDTDGNGTVTGDELSSALPALRNLALDSFTLAVDGRRLEGRVVTVDVNASDAARLETLSSGAATGRPAPRRDGAVVR